MYDMMPQEVAIEAVYDNPYQPRSAMDEESLQQLADTIKSQGFQGVLVARLYPNMPGQCQLTAGLRRREAAKRAGLKSLPVVVKRYTDQEMMTFALTRTFNAKT